MTTTIQISNITKQLLQQLKEKEHAESYNEIVLELVRNKLKVPKSGFGMFKGMRWNKEEDRPKDREL